MGSETEYSSKTNGEIELVPFETAEEAWFWFIQAQEAKNDGARFASGQGLYPRPCEPVDIYKAIDELYRNRRLVWDHMLVLRHYGIRRMAPDPYRVKEARAHKVWVEALDRLQEVLERKDIVRTKEWFHGVQGDVFDGVPAK